ncbi:MAG TPA: 3'(2'),5'-bisphosphate nucleotidase CysQ [Pseudomonadales bacterium]|nr:3'(2'),5'-bisphosphate nucleotidase CysQ [Pseudomonadales bacterium]
MSRFSPARLEALADGALAAVQAASRAILEVYGRADHGVETKADDSPLTAADRAAHDILVAALTRLAPGIPILSEEGEHASAATRRDWSACWVVDPLDGTREFVARNDEFTVNVALVEGSRPVLGIVGVPARHETYVGRVSERIAEHVDDRTGVRTPIHARPCPADPLVMASRSHRSEALESLLAALHAAFPGAREQAAGSALKLVELACGRCDGYPRRGPCAEWDIAAGEALLVAAGGQLARFDGAPLRYNKADTLLNPDFWAVGDPDSALARWFLAYGSTLEVTDGR